MVAVGFYFNGPQAYFILFLISAIYDRNHFILDRLSNQFYFSFSVILGQ